MLSAVYEGRLSHRRHATEATGDVAHAFDQRVTMILVALDEWDEFAARHPLWSSRALAPVSLRQRDFLGGGTRPLDGAVRDLVASRLGRRPSGRIALLTTPRVWGWLFNPLSVYYCFDDTGAIDAVVLEVTSTPWRERTAYVIDATRADEPFAKEMHVSPFMRRDLEYVVSFNDPGESIRLHLGTRRGDDRVFDAGMRLQRVGAERTDLAGLVWRRPFAAYAVTWGIYREAWRLWRKGAPFVARASRAVHPIERASR